MKNCFANGYCNIHLLPIFRKKIAFGKSGLPWTLPHSRKNISYKKGICPIAEEYHAKSFIGFANCTLDFTDKDFLNFEKAFDKVCSQIHLLKKI